MFTTVRTIVVWCCIILILSQSGCAHAPKPCLPDEVRAQLGTVGIVSARFRPDVDLSVPAKGWLAGAGRKSAQWAGKGALVPLQELGNMLVKTNGGGDFLIVSLVVATSVVAGTIGGIAGGVAGAFQAEPSDEVIFAEEVITTVMADLKMQETLGSRVAQVARSRTGNHVVVVPDQGPTSPEEKNAFGSLAGKGIDSVLELGVSRLALAGDWDLNPPLQFQMNLHIRLIQTIDGKELYDSSIEYFGGTLTFSEWADNNAKSFIAALDKAYQSLAEKIVREVFLLKPSPTPNRDTNQMIGNFEVKQPSRPGPASSDPDIEYTIQRAVGMINMSLKD